MAKTLAVGAAAGLVVGPAVIAAADGAAFDEAVAERDLTMGAAVGQREDGAVLGADEDDRVACKCDG